MLNIKSKKSKSNVENKRQYITVKINGHSCTLQLDTASDITIILFETWKVLGELACEATTHCAKNASGKQVDLRAEIRCTIELNGISSEGICYLSGHPNLNILGIDWIEKVGLWEAPVNSFCNQLKTEIKENTGMKSVNESETMSNKCLNLITIMFPNVFQKDLGHCNSIQAALKLKENSYIICLVTISL